MAYDDDDEGYDKPVEEGKTYAVHIEDLGSKGDGIARVEGFVVFVPETEVGETVRVEVNSVGRKFAFAEVVDRDVDEDDEWDEEDRYDKDEIEEDEDDEWDEEDRYDKDEVEEDELDEEDEDDEWDEEEDLDAPATEEELENDLGVDEEQMRRPDEL